MRGIHCDAEDSVIASDKPDRGEDRESAPSRTAGIGAVGALLRDLLRYIPSQLVPVLVGLISVPVLTRIFSPAEYGDYRLILSAAMGFGALVGALSSSIVRFYSEAVLEGYLSRLLGTVRSLGVWLSLSMAALWAITILVAGESLRPQLRFLGWLGIIYMLAMSLFAVMQGYLRAQSKPNWYSLASSWRAIGGFLLGLVLAEALGLGVGGMILGMALALIAFAPFAWAISLKDLRTGPADRQLVREIARFGLPLFAANIVSLTLRLSDLYVIEAVRGAVEVGIYSANYWLAEQAFGVIVTLFQLGFLPIAARLWASDGPEQTKVFISRTTGLFLTISVPAVVGLSVLARGISGVMTTTEYSVGYSVIPWIAASSFAMGMAVWIGVPFFLLKRTMPYVACVATGAIVNLALNVALVPRYGYRIAAVTTLIGYSVSLAIMIPIARKLLSWRFPFRTLSRASLAAGVMGVLVSVLFSALQGKLQPWLVLVASVAFGALVAGVILVAVGELRRESLSWINPKRKVG